MLVLKNIKDGEPFPSDLFTVLLYALDAEIDCCDLSTSNDAKLVTTTTAPKLVETTKNLPNLPWQIPLPSNVLLHHAQQDGRA